MDFGPLIVVTRPLVIVEGHVTHVTRRSIIIAVPLMTIAGSSIIVADSMMIVTGSLIIVTDAGIIVMSVVIFVTGYLIILPSSVTPDFGSLTISGATWQTIAVPPSSADGAMMIVIRLANIIHESLLYRVRVLRH